MKINASQVIVVIGVIVLMILIIGIINGVKRMNVENKQVKENCKSTELYAIGNKGHKIRIYDCGSK